VVLADAADLVSQLAATGKDPVGGWGRARHPSTLATRRSVGIRADPNLCDLGIRG
jgi:hypothetical protein